MAATITTINYSNVPSFPPLHRGASFVLDLMVASQTARCFLTGSAHTDIVCLFQANKTLIVFSLVLWPTP